jgi:hypothetical protein
MVKKIPISISKIAKFLGLPKPPALPHQHNIRNKLHRARGQNRGHDEPKQINQYVMLHIA